MLKYKGYAGKVSLDEESLIFHGEIVGLRDVITFQGTTAKELKEEFEKSIDDYLDWCNELGQKPEKPFSGNIHLRLEPEVHAKLAAEAKVIGMSLNNYINNRLQDRAGL